VLDAAMQAFWERGFEATSMTDLMAATGLHKGSLYKAFEDKHGLFMATLGRYLDERADAQRTLMEAAQSPRAGIREVLVEAVAVGSQAQRMQRGDRYGRGCFAVNSVVELTPHDREVAKHLDTHIRRTIERLTEAVAAGQAQSEFRRDVDAGELGQWLLVVLTGLLASLRGPLDARAATRLVDLSLRLM
ncbi:MAG: TetR/AcrR family transcriptional regulator, partial [bacterium]|nr:TetR/AcrR family transcriptional regulator [bacterium]